MGIHVTFDFSVIYQVEKISGTSWATDEERWELVLWSCWSAKLIFISLPDFPSLRPE